MKERGERRYEEGKRRRREGEERLTEKKLSQRVPSDNCSPTARRRVIIACDDGCCCCCCDTIFFGTVWPGSLFFLGLPGSLGAVLRRGSVAASWVRGAGGSLMTLERRES